MKPRRGEKPPFSKSSRSQSCRGVRFHDSHARDASRSSPARAGSTSKLISIPPWGVLRLESIFYISLKKIHLHLVLNHHGISYDSYYMPKSIGTPTTGIS